MLHHAHNAYHVFGLTGFFLLGLFGSLHCVLMCGPLSVVILSKRKPFSGLLVYHLCRLVSYSGLGFVFHELGQSLEHIIAFPIVFSFMILVLLFSAFDWSVPMPAFVVTLYTRSQRLVQNKGIFVQSILLGLLTPLLPCGLLYMAFSAALMAPDAWVASLWMSAFACGTYPLLIAGQSGMRYVAKYLSPQNYRLMRRILAVIALLAMVLFYLQHS